MSKTTKSAKIWLSKSILYPSLENSTTDNAIDYISSRTKIILYKTIKSQIKTTINSMKAWKSQRAFFNFSKLHVWSWGQKVGILNFVDSPDIKVSCFGLVFFLVFFSNFLWPSCVCVRPRRDILAILSVQFIKGPCLYNSKAKNLYFAHERTFVR